MKTTNQILDEMKAKALGASYQEAIREIYQADVDAGTFEEDETEFASAKAVLPEMLSEEKLKLLAEAEAACVKIREYSAEFGFMAGLFCGFRQHFTTDDEFDGGYNKTVFDEIAMKPRMERHPKNYENIERRNQLFDQINADESEEVQEHIASVICCWDQRAHSASVNGFYYGYRAAMSIIREVDITSMFGFPQKLLSMEHALGFIKSYEQIEREMERKAEAAE